MIAYKFWLSWHLISIVAWFAGLFYLPRLFVYHTQARGDEAQRLFCTMEQKLYKIIMVPAFLSTLLSGSILIYLNTLGWLTVASWMHIKLTFILALIVYHHYLGFCVKRFKNGTNKCSETYFRVLNEAPTVVLVVVIFLAKFKPLALY